MKSLALLATLPLLAAAQTGAIEGKALNKLTKAPIAGVHIKMTDDADASKYYSARTDGNGVYRFDNLPVGKYSPWIDAPDGFYPPSPIEMMMKRTRVEVTDGGTAKFDTELTPASTLRGRVLGPDGPVAGITLAATPVTGIRPGLGRSDKEGRFSIQLSSGKYHLAVLPPDEWAQTYYPGVLDKADALPIDIPEGVDLGGYDIRLRRIEGHRLSGVVRDPAGKPVAGARLSISAPGADSWRNAKAKSDEHGGFEFDHVAAGEWRVLAKLDVDLTNWQGAAVVNMPDRDYDRVEVRVDPPFTIGVAMEGAPQERRPMRFQLAPPSGPTLFLTATEHDGRGQFEGVYPGRYRAGLFGMLPGRYLQSILLGPSDITGRLVDFGPGLPELRYVFAEGGGQISGEVEDGAGAHVTVLWADRDQFVPGADSFSTTADDHGRFRIADLRPGNWYVIAYRKGPIFNLRERIFDRGMWREAASVKVAERETAGVKLSVTLQ